MGVGLGIWWRGAAMGSVAPASTASVQGIAPAQFLSVDVLRSAEDAAQMPRLDLPAGEGHVVVRIPAPNDAGPFRARLLGPIGELARVEPLSTDDFGLISLDADLAVLRRANRLAVDSAQGSGWVQRLEIVLVPANATAK